jgi:hypothetical protein
MRFWKSLAALTRLDALLFVQSDVAEASEKVAQVAAVGELKHQHTDRKVSLRKSCKSWKANLVAGVVVALDQLKNKLHAKRRTARLCTREAEEGAGTLMMGRGVSSVWSTMLDIASGIACQHQKKAAWALPKTSLRPKPQSTRTLFRK